MRKLTKLPLCYIHLTLAAQLHGMVKNSLLSLLSYFLIHFECSQSKRLALDPRETLQTRSSHRTGWHQDAFCRWLVEPIYNLFVDTHQ